MTSLEISGFFYYIKQIDFMLLCVCSVTDHRGGENVAGKSLTLARAGTMLFLPHFKVICDFLQNRHKATCNRFVK